MRLSIKKKTLMTHLAMIIALVLVVAACSGDSGSPADSQAGTTQAAPTAVPAAPSPATPAPTASMEQVDLEPIEVVTTTNIVADWAQVVGGDRVNVLSLLPAGSDPHTYQPGAQDVAAIADADLVLAVGLGLEESWLRELLENAARDESSMAGG